jgi:hypothetical protein
MDAAAVLLSSRTPGNAMVALFVDYLDGFVAAVARCRVKMEQSVPEHAPFTPAFGSEVPPTLMVGPGNLLRSHSIEKSRAVSEYANPGAAVSCLRIR